MSAVRQAATAASADVYLERLIKSCRSHNQLRQAHARIIRQGLEQDQYVISIFINRYGVLCRSSVYAQEVFNCVAEPNTCLWNTLVKVNSECSTFCRALTFLKLMRRREEVRPDGFTFPPVIKSCAAAEEWRVGASLHASVFRLGLDADVYVVTALVDFYGKCSDLTSARKLFLAMKAPNVVSFTAMISGYLRVGDLIAARALFAEVHHRNAATWNVMIGGCVKLGDLNGARELFDEMPERDFITFTTLIDGYAKAGDMVSAESLFRQLPHKDIFSWSAMISGYAQNGHPKDAIKLFLEMLQQKVNPDAHVFVGLLSACSQLGCTHLARWADTVVSQSQANLLQPHIVAALIDMNAKCGNLDRARSLFEEMPRRTLLAYCSLMQGYSFHGHGAAAVELFRRLLAEGLMPDTIVFTVLLTACNYSSLVEEGKVFFNFMREKHRLTPSVDHYACMVDLLARSGSLEEAYQLILSMDEEPHAGVWGALLRGCCIHGAIQLGEIAADKLFLIEPANAGNYVLLSNIYAAADRWADVCEVRRRMRERGIKKVPGCSWV